MVIINENQSSKPQIQISNSFESEGPDRLRATRSIFVFRSPKWAGYWLIAAGIYNLAWGAITIAFPNLIFELTGAKRINYPEIWQCVGMIVGGYGIGYLIAAWDSRTHWPIVLVGPLGKIFGPIGFGVALARGIFPPLFGVTILTNDLLWWIPFGLILSDAAKQRQRSLV